ncbi:MAG: CHAT domain-containing protein, partial [Gammaproteobacteria bacterium]|nr:CHAT domain-containing protein [Gammaproteobacteria bacterium]
RLGELDAMPILHISCHGHNAYRAHPAATAQPVLLLEDDQGDTLPTDAGTLVQTLGAHKPRLLALSACLTAASAAPQNDADPEIADSLATALVRAGVPAVLAWEGSVSDHEAIDFAQSLYRELGNRNPLELAIGSARRQLLHQGCQGEASRDWHLARLWCGPAGGGPLVGGKRKRMLVSANRGFKEFLDKRAHRSPVASREAFVGRRREIQSGLRVLREDQYAGLLIHGMGRLGKSSLAARLAHRLGNAYAIAVVYAYYDARSVFESIFEAVKSYQAARERLDAARNRLQDDPAQLEGILLDLLSGPCAQQDAQGPPLLLIIDDLERILEVPQPGSPQLHTVSADDLVSLRAILRAFRPDTSDSRLILTSRYQFTLTDSSADGELANKLYPLQPPPLPQSTRRKLTLRQTQQIMRESSQTTPVSETDLEAKRSLLARTEKVARGNPGLQELLTGLIFAPSATAAGSAQTLDQMEAYLTGQTGSQLNEEKIQAFLQDLALEKLVGLASPAARELLRQARLFAQPVPRPVIALLGDDQAVTELQGLGLFDQFEDLVNPTQAAIKINELAQASAGELRNSEKAALAKRVLARLFEAWGGVEDQDRPSAADQQLTQLGLLVNDIEVLQTCAAHAIAGLQERDAYGVAAQLGRQAIAVLDRAGHQPPAQLLRRTGENCV